MSIPLRNVAEDYAMQHLSVVAGFERSKVPAYSHAHYAYERPSSQELDAVFSFTNYQFNIGVVGGVAGDNSAVLDAETKAAFHEQRRRFERAGYGDTILVESPRGGHIHFRTPEPICGFKTADYEVRGHGQFTLMPPSIHPSGARYKFLSRSASIVEIPDLRALHWLPLKPAITHKPIPPRASRLLKGFDHRGMGSRSEVEQAIVTLLWNAGFGFEEVLRLFRTFPAAGKFREREAINADDAMRWLRVCYESARIFCLQDSPARQLARARATDALSVPWAGRTGSTDRAVFLAHLTLAHRAGREHYHASSRNLAEFAGVESKTAWLATRRLTTSGLIHLVERSKHLLANRFRLGKELEKGKDDHIPSHVLCKSVVNIPLFASEPLPDCFRKKGLGRASFEVLQALESGPQQANQLAKTTGRCVKTVRRCLNRMRTVGITSKDKKLWRGTPIVDLKLSELAFTVGTAGASYKQKNRHRAERLRHTIMTRLPLEAIK